MSSGTGKYGKWYYCVQVLESISPDGKIYVMADRVVITDNGSLLFIGSSVDGEHEFVNLGLSNGQWIAFFATSVLDGHPIGVEYWKGEVNRE